MIVTKKSILTGKVHTMDLPITQEQIDSWRDGKLIQDAMPQLDREQREFLISGITPKEWREAFGSH